MVDISEFYERRVEEADLSTGDNELSLAADSNESYQVMDIAVDGADEDTIAKVTIGEESMLAFPAGDGEDELFLEESILDEKMSLYGYMRDQGLPAPPFQVPEGDDFLLTTDSDSGTATVFYMEGDANMANPTQPGGPETKRRLFVSSGEKTENIASTSTQNTFEDFTSRNPAEFQDFPYGEDVPANREYDLIALSLALVNDNTSGATIDDFRLLTDEQAPLADDKDFVDADLAEYPDADLENLPFIFPGMPTFSPGDELDLEVRATSGSGTGDVTIRASYIFDRRPV